MTKQISKRLSMMFIFLAVLTLGTTGEAQAQGCCQDITPTVFAGGGPGPCCFDIFLDRQDYQGCEMTRLRVTSLGGFSMNSASINYGSTFVTQSTPTVAIFDHPSQFPMSNEYVGTICFSSADECGTITIELYDFNNSTWTCLWTFEGCCGQDMQLQ